MGTNTHPRRNLARVLLVTSLMILSFVHSAPRAEESVTVDFDAVTGYVGDPIATGHRGIWAGVMPDSLITPLKQSVGGVTPQPWESADSTWERAAANGTILEVALYDGPGYWHVTSWADSGDLAERMQRWGENVHTLVEYAETHQVVNGDTVTVHFDVWNEPDTDSWNPHASYGDPADLFHEVWKTAVDTVRAHGGIVAGPSFAGSVSGLENGRVHLDPLLAYWRDHDCWPDVFAWHHNANYDFTTNDASDTTRLNLYHQTLFAKQKLYQYGGDTASIRLEVNEMLGADNFLIPGVLSRNFALAERAKSEGLLFVGRTFWCQEPTQPLCGGIVDPFDPEHPDWCYTCTNDSSGIYFPVQGTRLSGLVVPYGPDLWKKRYGWWLYKAYADLDGEYVTVTPLGASFDGLASRDVESQTARVLLGRYQGQERDSVTVILENLDAVPGMITDGIVQVEVRRYPGSFGDVWTGGIADGDLPVPSFSRRYPVGLDNTLSLTLGGEAAFDSLDAVSIVLSAPAFVSRTAAQ